MDKKKLCEDGGKDAETWSVDGWVAGVLISINSNEFVILHTFIWGQPVIDTLNLNKNRKLRNNFIFGFNSHKERDIHYLDNKPNIQKQGKTEF